jgi:hypothetical protein
MTRRLAALALAGLAALGVAACSSSDDDSGATTNLEEVGPDLAKLRLEVSQLRAEVRTLQETVESLVQATPTTEPLETDPSTGLPIQTTPTTIASG